MSNSDDKIEDPTNEINTEKNETPDPDNNESPENPQESEQPNENLNGNI